MKKKSECSASVLMIESSMDNNIVSANDHRKVGFSEKKM